MTDEEKLIHTINRMIYGLPPDQQEACRELAEHFRQNMRRAGSAAHAHLALALVGAEAQAGKL